MITPVSLCDIRLRRVSHSESGLLGWVSFEVAGLFSLHGIALRRTLDGRLALAFPRRTQRSGKRYFFSRPLDDESRMEIEAQVFAALRSQGAIS
jgi:DNA-binding cell septation regulator SpoVG